MTRVDTNGNKGCEFCRKSDPTVKLHPKVWDNMLQDYVEHFICDTCESKWVRVDLPVIKKEKPCA